MSEPEPFAGGYARVVRQPGEQAGRVWEVVNRNGQPLTSFPYFDLEKANRRAERDEKRLSEQAEANE